MTTTAKPIGEQVIGALQKKFGARTAQLGASGADSEVTGYVSTQCPTLDYMIGRPGIPKGRLTTIVGQEGAGKSTLGLHLIKETQERGGMGILMDTEHRLWIERAEQIGVKFDDTLLLLQPEYLEQGFEQLVLAIQGIRGIDSAIGITAVIDSIAGCPTKSDLDEDLDSNVPAAHARFMSRAMRTIHPLISRHNVALVFVNQLRYKLDFKGYGGPKMVMLAEKTINYWSSLKIFVEQGKKLVKGSDKDAPPYGVQVKARIIESRISPREGFKGTFDLNYLTGIDWVTSALDVLVSVGASEYQKAGGWYVYKGGARFRRSKFAEQLKAHPELVEYVAAAPLLWLETAVEAEEEN